jgi:hypothetical protein
MSYRILLLFMFGTVAGCSRSLDRTELPDAYRFISGNLMQEITISPDGNYLNAFYREGLLVWSDREGWTPENQKGQLGITLAKFRFGIISHSDAPGYWFVVPEKTLTGIKRLCFDPDLDQCFVSR